MDSDPESYSDYTTRRAAIGKIPTKIAFYLQEEFFEPLPLPEPDDWLACHEENGQSFTMFQNHHRKPTGSKNIIYIQPLDSIDSSMLAFMRIYCKVFYAGFEVKMLPSLSLKKLKIPHRLHNGILQYHAGKIIEALTLPPDGFCLIAVTFMDLYPRDSWNFVFGLAAASKGVFSFARYIDHDLPEQSRKEHILYRAVKVMTHEIGHMFSLKHCIYYKCLMNGSNHALENTRKLMHLCPVCLKKIHSVLKFDIGQRYANLAELCNRSEVFHRDRQWFLGQLEFENKTANINHTV